MDSSRFVNISPSTNLVEQHSEGRHYEASTVASQESTNSVESTAFLPSQMLAAAHRDSERVASIPPSPSALLGSACSCFSNSAF